MSHTSPRGAAMGASEMNRITTMNASRLAATPAVTVSLGLSALAFGAGPVSAFPLNPPPSPAPGGPAMAPGTSSPPTTNITHPGVGPGGAHGGQNQTKAPGES